MPPTPPSATRVRRPAAPGTASRRAHQLMPSIDPTEPTEPTEASQFYTGIVAEIYAPLRSRVPDPEPYARFIAASGEPALELGCGTGDPLLDLRARGLDVEGLDASADMLARC